MVIKVLKYRIMPELRGLLEVMTERVARGYFFKKALERGHYPILCTFPLFNLAGH